MIHVVDTLHLGRPHIVAAHVLAEQGAESLTLIDCGPASVFENVIAGLRGLGLKPENVRHLLLTHIHLDHAGGAWRWAQEFGTQVHVHPRGAAHLLDPSKLLASASRIYGDRMDTLWGRIEPVSAECLRVLEDGAFAEIGAPRIQAIVTPGHAPHHHVFWMPETRVLFAGDIAGVIIDDGPVLPPCPPPDINIEEWRASLNRLRELAPAEIRVTHYGLLPDPFGALDHLEARLISWSKWMLERLREGRAETDLGSDFREFVADEFRCAGLNEERIKSYEQAGPAQMSIAGLARYWRKHHPELLELKS